MFTIKFIPRSANFNVNQGFFTAKLTKVPDNAELKKFFNSLAKALMLKNK